MKFYGYNDEAENKNHNKVYTRSALLGIIIAIFFILFGKSFIFFIKISFKYWMFFAVGIFALIIIKKFIVKYRREN